MTVVDGGDPTAPPPPPDPAIRRAFRRAVLARLDELARQRGDPAAVLQIGREMAAGALPANRRDWLHEDLGIVAKDAVFDAARSGGGRIDAAGVVAASRLYTPDHIVAFLLQNSLGARWAEMHPASVLPARWDLLVAGAVRPGRAPTPLRDVRVLDPCCGCGAFLLAAFDMLADLYEDERRLAAAGLVDPEWTVAASDTGRAIVERNLVGADLDADAVAIARDLLAERAGGGVQPRLTVPPGPIGSLDRAVWRGEAFDVVATNPPYVGFRMLHPEVKAAVRAQDPLARTDLAVAFQRRCLELTGTRGMCATVTPAAWLASRESLDLREAILAAGSPRVTAILGQRVFDAAPLLFVGLSVVERGGDRAPLRVLRPASGSGRRGLAAAAAGGGIEVPRSLLLGLPLRPFLPAAPPAVLRLARSGPRLGDLFTSFDGIWTGSNARDTRHWWELPTEAPAWRALSGGQGNEPWFAATRLRVRREHAAGQADRRGGVEYARVAGGRLAARAVDGDSAALAGVVTLMPRPGSEGRVEEVLAIFNSRIGAAWLQTLAGGLNFNPGSAAEIPLGRDAPPPELATIVRALVERRRLVCARDPTAAGFVDTLPPWHEDPVGDEIALLEAEMEAVLAAHLAVPARDLATLPAPWRRPDKPAERLRDHLMVRTLRIMGMRWPVDGHVPPPPRSGVRRRELIGRLRDVLAAEGAPVDDLDPVRWVEREFLTFQARRFRRRPVAIAAGDRLCLASPAG